MFIAALGAIGVVAAPAVACTVTTTTTGPQGDAGSDTGASADAQAASDATLDATDATDATVDATSAVDGSSDGAPDAACGVVEFAASTNITYQPATITGGGQTGPFCTVGPELTYESVGFRFEGRKPVLSFALPADIANALRTMTRIKTVELTFTVARGGGYARPCDQQQADGGVLNTCIDDWFACPLDAATAPEQDGGGTCTSYVPQFPSPSAPLCGSRVGFNFRDAADTQVTVGLGLLGIKDRLVGDVLTVGLQAGDDVADGLRADIYGRGAAPGLQPRLRMQICQ